MLKDLFLSLCQIFKHMLLGKCPDVLLYYPQHFNRSSEGINPYFKPIIDLCRESGIRYLVLEEPDYTTIYPRDNNSLKADFFFLSIIIIRKLMGIFRYEQTEADIKIAPILNILTLCKFRAKTYITISNSMIDIWGAWNTKGRVFDYQHGILYSDHPGYFIKSGIFQPSYLNSNHGILLWGNLYKKYFESAMPQIEYDKRIKVVGYPLISSNVERKSCCRDRILISLQMTLDYPALLKDEYDMLCETLDVLAKTGYHILLKHHPRFNNCFDLEEVFKLYPFVEITNRPIHELVKEVFFHITWNSTTAFEYANYGIPTFFLSDERWNVGDKLFYGQYNYPLYKNMTITEVMFRIKDKSLYEKDCFIVKQWYDSAYSPFDKKLMLQVLLGYE